MPYDMAVLRALNSHAGKSASLDRLIVFFARYVPYFLGALFFVFLFTVPESQQQKAFLITCAATLLARFGVTELVRLFYKRPRPFDTHELHALFAKQEWSFPSGHAVFFFALATSVAFFDVQWAVVFFLGALVACVARVAAGVHYPSDILWGAFIGIIVAYGTIVAVGL